MAENPSLPQVIFKVLAGNLTKAETHDEMHDYGRAPENVILSSNVLIQFSKCSEDYVRLRLEIQERPVRHTFYRRTISMHMFSFKLKSVIHFARKLY